MTLDTQLLLDTNAYRTVFVTNIYNPSTTNVKGDKKGASTCAMIL
jgi:hypothetical protein